MIVRASTEDEYKIWLARQQMFAVLEGGLELQAYVWLYFDRDPKTQVEEVAGLFDDMPFTCIWLDCEDNVFGANVIAYIRTAIDILIMEWPVGIYTSRGWWWAHTGDSTQFAFWPLFDAHWRENPTMEDFVPYGGWDHCLMSQYAPNVYLGGVVVDMNIYSGRA